MTERSQPLYRFWNGELHTVLFRGEFTELDWEKRSYFITKSEALIAALKRHQNRLRLKRLAVASSRKRKLKVEAE